MRVKADRRDIRYLAERWVEQYGPAAPAQIRGWARDATNDPDGAQLLEEVARIAESVLQGRTSAEG